MKHTHGCRGYAGQVYIPGESLNGHCTCTPIESPEEKLECKDTCEEEKGGWEERFEDGEWIGSSSPSWNDDNVDGYIKCKEEVKSFLRSELATAREEERKRIDEEITKQFKYASENDNYDMRGVDWSAIIRPRN